MSGQVAHAQRLVELGRYAEARTLLATLLAAEPDSVALHGLMTQVLIGLGDLPAALDSGNRLVALRPDDEWGHRLCSIVLDRMDRSAEATVAAAQAVRLDPTSWVTHHVYALAAGGTHDLQWEGHQAALRAVELAPHEPGAHFSLGWVAQQRGDHALAREAYQRTLALEPDHALALNNLTVLDGTRNLSRAAQGFGASLRNAPGTRLVQRNVEGLAAAFVRRVYLAGLVAFLVGLVVALASGGVGIATVSVAVALVAGIAAYTVRLGRAVPLGVRRFVLLRMRRDPFLIANQALAAAMVAAAIVVCVVPGGALLGVRAIQLVGLANVAMVVWTVARRNRA